MKTPGLVWLAVLLALPAPCGAVSGKITIRSISATNFPTASSFGKSIVRAMNTGTFASPKTASLVAALKQIDLENPQSLSAVDPVAYRLTMMARANPALFPGVGADVAIGETIGASLGLVLARMGPDQRDKLIAEALEGAAAEVEAHTQSMIAGMDGFLKKHPNDAVEAMTLKPDEFEALKNTAEALYKASTLFSMYLKDDASRAAAKTAYEKARAKVDALEGLKIGERMQADEEKLAADRQRLSEVKKDAIPGSFGDWAMNRTAGDMLVKNMATKASQNQTFFIESLTPDLLGADEAKALAALAKLESVVKDIQRDEQKMVALDRFLRVVQKTPDESRRERALATVEKLTAGSASAEVAAFVKKRLAAQIGELNARKLRRDIAVGGIERENQRVLEVSPSLDQRIARLEKALSWTGQIEAIVVRKTPEPQSRLRRRLDRLSQSANAVFALWVGSALSRFLTEPTATLTVLAALFGLGFAALQVRAGRIEAKLVASDPEARVDRRYRMALAAGLLALSPLIYLVIPGAVGALVGLLIAVGGMIVLLWS